MKTLLRRIFSPGLWLFNLVATPFRRWRAFFTEVPEEATATEALTDILDSREGLAALWHGLGEHVNALRRHVLRAVLALAITSTLSFILADKFMATLAAPLSPRWGEIFTLPNLQKIGGAITRQEWAWLLTVMPVHMFSRFIALGQEALQSLVVIKPTEAIGIFFRLSMLAGLTLAMPWIVMELYLFIAPGLMPRTRVQLLAIIPLASGLFVAGMSFCYFFMLPAALPFLYTFMGLRSTWQISAYFDLVTSLLFWIGVTFQMPLIIYALAAAGLIRAEHLLKQWRLAVIGFAILAAFITPTSDPYNMLLVMLPMVVLYGFSIVGAAIAQTGRQKDMAAHRRAAARPK